MFIKHLLYANLILETEDIAMSRTNKGPAHWTFSHLRKVGSEASNSNNFNKGFDHECQGYTVSQRIISLNLR